MLYVPSLSFSQWGGQILDQSDGAGQHIMRSATHPWRITQTRHRGLGKDCVKANAKVEKGSITNLAHFSRQSLIRTRLDRFSRHPNRELSRALRPGRACT
jgi:hypothetical protein